MVTYYPSKGDNKIVHGVENSQGDDMTLCGLPLVDEAEKFKETEAAISCDICSGVLDRRDYFKKVRSKWK